MPRNREFLSCVKDVFGKGWRAHLEFEYTLLGVDGLARKWGFHSNTVRWWLRREGLLKEGRWAVRGTCVEEKVRALGGVGGFLKRGVSAKKLGALLGLGNTVVKRLIVEEGYEYDPKRRVWRKSNDVR